MYVKSINFERRGWPGEGGGSEKQRFLFKVQLKSIDFERRSWPGEGGGSEKQQFLIKI